LKPREKKITIGVVAALLVVGTLILAFQLSGSSNEPRSISLEDVLSRTSTRKPLAEDVVVIPEEEPFFGITATPVSCWYDIGAPQGEEYGLIPLLVSSGGALDDVQSRFMSNTGRSTQYELDIQGEEDTSYSPGSSGAIGRSSIQMAEDSYQEAAGAMILEGNVEQYEMGILAAPLASYLNIPIMVKDRIISWSEIGSTLNDLGADYVICIGASADDIADQLGMDTIYLRTEEEVQDAVLEAVKNRFGKLDYITMTNPADTVPLDVASSDTETFNVDVNNLRVETGTIALDIIGESSDTFSITVPDGIARVSIYINFTNVRATFLDPLKDAIEIEPIIFASLYDSSGEIAAYAPSFAFEPGHDYLETLAVDAPGDYELTVQVFYGIDGFNTYAGTELAASRIDGSYEVTVTREILNSMHFPQYSKLSMMAPYLASSHGGSVFGGSYLELTQEEYREASSGHSTGPCYDKDLHSAVNERVDQNIEKLEAYLEKVDDHGLYDDYVAGPAWFAILGGPNMIPQYYEPKDESWVEDPIYGTGWPTDVPYGFEQTLSTARVMGEDVGDVSALIARTLFYESYAEGHSRMISSEYGVSEVS
jgi:hypothetical protein